MDLNKMQADIQRQNAITCATALNKGEPRTAEELVASARVIEAYLTGQDQLDEVYRFAGWLTSRDTEITASAHHDSAPWAEACAEYIAQRGKANG